MHNDFVPFTRRQFLATGLSLASSTAWPQAPATPSAALEFDETWTDARRQRRVPVRCRLPVQSVAVGPWPLIVYSHGLGGSRAGGGVWGRAWAAAGCVVVHVQHAGSDIEAVRPLGGFRDMAALRKLGSAEQLLARLDDVAFVMDEVTRLSAFSKLWVNVRPSAVGVAGHSFGAHTTLGVGGQTYPGYAGKKDPRVAALIALSPSLPARGSAAQAFAAITAPTLCITGTLDGDVLGNGSAPDKRAAVFAALPPGNKAQLVLKDADHMTLGGNSADSQSLGGTERESSILPREALSRSLQGQHHALVARVTADWWRAHLGADAGAKDRLLQPAGLGSGDTWQRG